MEHKTAPVRKSDPATSHLAAAGSSALGRTTVRSRVLAILTSNTGHAGAEGLTHDGLIAAYKKYAVRLGWPRASDSSIRTRCNELWRDGQVVRVEERAGKSGMGRAAILWRAADVQSNETAGNAGVSR